MGEIRQAVAENIKRICTLKGIKQVEISEYMGISQGTVSNWFKGTNSIDIENLAKLCQFLEVSLDQVFGVEPLPTGTLLSKDESELLEYYRSLNKTGKDTILVTARAVAGNPDMQKE